jgi:hypothetical protein
MPGIDRAGAVEKRDNPGYYYVSYYEYPEAPEPGTYADITVAQPTLDPGDSHTLAEIAAQSADSQQIVEIGWTVDRGINGGSSTPHLFTFSWLNGEGKGYDAANPYYHPISNVGSNPDGYFTGMELPVSSTPRRFLIRHYMGNWLLGIAGPSGIDYFGYFPDSEWSGLYTSIGLAQWFGEVNDSNDGLGCTQMGNGVFGTAAGAATVGTPVYYQNDAGDTVFADPTLIVTNPSDYNGDPSTGGFGGPGPCVSPPPQTHITQHPTAKVKTRTQHANVTFSFISGAGNFRCRIDGGGFSHCNSPATFRVGIGQHTFAVNARDTFGRTGPNATFNFKVVHKSKHHAAA